MNKLILASASPRRKEILTNLNLEFTSISSNIEEKVDYNQKAPEIAKELAYLKAKDIANNINGNKIVIGADTIVEHNGILGKPLNEEDAYNMLNSLSGNVHRVITGFAIIDLVTKNEYVDYESTYVHFKNLTHEEIKAYIATGEPMDKAGSYGIQGKAALFISKIEGDYFNVVGLPLFKLGVVLQKHFNFSLL